MVSQFPTHPASIQFTPGEGREPAHLFLRTSVQRFVLYARRIETVLGDDLEQPLVLRAPQMLDGAPRLVADEPEVSHRR